MTAGAKEKKSIEHHEYFVSNNLYDGILGVHASVFNAVIHHTIFQTRFGS